MSKGVKQAARAPCGSASAWGEAVGLCPRGPQLTSTPISKPIRGLQQGQGTPGQGCFMCRDAEPSRSGQTGSNREEFVWPQWEQRAGPRVPQDVSEVLPSRQCKDRAERDIP